MTKLHEFDLIDIFIEVELKLMFKHHLVKGFTFWLSCY